MFRKIVDFYYRVRYFHRLLLAKLDRITEAVQTLQAIRENNVIQDRPAQAAFSGEAVLANLQHEFSAFCDDMTRFMIASRSSTADHAARLAVLQQGHKRLEDTVLATEASQLQSITAAVLEMQGLRAKLAELAEMMQAQSQTIGARLGQAEEAASRESQHFREALGQQAAHLARLGAATERQTGEAARQAAELSQTVARQAEEIGRIGRMVGQQIRLLPSNLFDPETTLHVRDTLALLRPVGAQGMDKLRVGRDHDGGYIMLDDFGRIGAAVSLGIADDASWDMDVAERGIDVLQFDPSISAPPAEHARFRFESLRVLPYDSEGGISLETIVKDRVADTNAMLLLKIDIEGGEWDVFNAVDDAILRRFAQVVCEFHDLDRLAEPDFGARAKKVFEKLAKTHAVIHVHGNNCANFANVGNVVFPQVLEVSFASREVYAFADVATKFPTALDRANQPGRADLFLGDFDFSRKADMLVTE